MFALAHLMPKRLIERRICAIVVRLRRAWGSRRDNADVFLYLRRRDGTWEDCKRITLPFPESAERQGKEIPWSLSLGRASDTLLSVLIRGACGTGEDEEAVGLYD